jgi:transcriptional regulator with XRE-family HTH domain
MGRNQTPASGKFARAVSGEIRAAMAKQRVSQMELAKDIGKSQNYLSKRLRDETPFDLNDLHLITGRLRMDMPALMRGAENAARKDGDSRGAES